ncbi:TPA: hypothetical protein NJL94_005819 [Pseudomonas aeruginosa]|nr:hypothetical protein [Pseudomonas aeruginosa]
MKNIVENQGIKTDKPLPMSYEALKAERDALERQLLMSEAKCKGYFSDAAAALIKSDALAVENQALRSSVDLIASAYTEGEPAGFEIDRARHIETPATDAALAAIQAQGVEKYAADLDQIASESNPAEPKHTVASSYADDARSFAKKLREAK